MSDYADAYEWLAAQRGVSDDFVHVPIEALADLLRGLPPSYPLTAPRRNPATGEGKVLTTAPANTQAAPPGQGAHTAQAAHPSRLWQHMEYTHSLVLTESEEHDILSVACASYDAHRIAWSQRIAKLEDALREIAALSPVDGLDMGSIAREALK